MRNRINKFLNVVMGCCVGFFAGYSAYTAYDFKKHPGLYAMQSAPWYTGILLYGALTLGVILLALIAKIIIRKK